MYVVIATSLKLSTRTSWRPQAAQTSHLLIAVAVAVAVGRSLASIDLPPAAVQINFHSPASTLMCPYLVSIVSFLSPGRSIRPAGSTSISI